MLKKISYITLSLALVAGVGFSGLFAHAAATITTPATANISSNSVTGASVALPAMVVTEGAAGDIHTGQQTWVLPAGFVFDTSSVANVSLTGTGLTASSSVVSFPDSTHFSLTITSTSTVAGTLTVGSTTPLKVKATSGTPLASGNITMSAGSINGVTSSTNFGTLTEVAGTASKLGFSIQPPATTTVSSGFSAQVAVQDQFGNTVTTDNSRNIMLSSNLVSGTAGTLSGTTTMADASGVSGFTGLSFNQPATIELVAQSAGLTGATSSLISVTALPDTTAPTVPTGLAATSTASSSVSLAWAASSDPDNATSTIVYNVFRNGVQVATTTAGVTSFMDTGLTASTTYSYTVSASDPAKNTSAQSSSVMVTTLASTTPPTTPVFLADGTLVQLEGNSTIYIVKNGKLHVFQPGNNGKGNGDDNEGIEQGDQGNGGNGNDDSGSSRGNSGNPSQGDAVIVNPGSIISDDIKGTIVPKPVIVNTTAFSDSGQTDNSGGHGHNNANAGIKNGVIKPGRGQDN